MARNTRPMRMKSTTSKSCRSRCKKIKPQPVTGRFKAAQNGQVPCYGKLIALTTVRCIRNQHRNSTLRLFKMAAALIGTNVEQVEDALSKVSGLGDFTSQKVVARDGARFYGVYDFPSWSSRLLSVTVRGCG